MKAFLVLLPLILSFMLFTPTVHVVIEPATRPTINFWCGSPPKNNETLQFSAENDIEYTVYLARSKLTEEYAQNIHRAIKNNVSIHVAIGLSSGFLNIKNVEDLNPTANMIRTWLINNGLYEGVKSVIVDAEPSNLMFKGLENRSGAIDKISYFMNDVPDQIEEDEIEAELNAFVDSFKEDGKRVGIAKMPLYYDEIDGDNDISLLLRNIYMLDVDWDYSVSMIYRTHHQASMWDMILSNLEETHEKTSEFELEYYTMEDTEKWLMNDASFYYRTSYEVSGTDVNVDRENRYVILGTFFHKFEDTSYIQDKTYLKDVDICRHFGMDTVYLYYYEGFVSRYNKQELRTLVDHVDQQESWILEAPSWHLQREIFLGLFTITFDRFLYT